jgi:hypothetical protein
MIGEVSLWNPDADPLLIAKWINNHYRSILAARRWYGTLVRGQIVVPQMVMGGTATVNTGDADVAGNGTTWDPTIIGQQFRIGYQSQWRKIIALDQANQVLTLDMPYAGQPRTTGYQITTIWVTLGNNINSVLKAVNQQQGWPMSVNVPQQTLDELDPWRTEIGWARCLASKEPTPDGQLQVEIWPAPLSPQAFPFLAFMQPADLVGDDDSPVVYIRSDVIVSLAISDALVWRGPKKNPYYDPQVAMQKKAYAVTEIEKMMNDDDTRYSQDASWDYGFEGAGGRGYMWAQSHAVSAGEM